MSENCIFCKIIKGEIPSYTVYEDNDFKAILDIFPASLGHTVLIPKYHAESVFELPDEFASKAFPAVKKLSAKIKNALNCEGINILQNNGAAAGQTVPHFHIHLIPRNSKDNIQIEWEQTDVNRDVLADICSKITEKGAEHE